MTNSSITERIRGLVGELDALYAEASSRKLTQRELRVRFTQLKRINADLGQAQFDMANSPIWEYLPEEDRKALNGFIDETIKGADMIEEALRRRRQ